MTEFIETFGKLFIMKRSRTGHNRARTVFRKANQKAYYALTGTI